MLIYVLYTYYINLCKIMLTIKRHKVELTIKYGAIDVAKYWPQFYSVDSSFFSYKNKLVPALPQSINDLDDLPSNYKVTKDNRQFLAVRRC